MVQYANTFIARWEISTIGQSVRPDCSNVQMFTTFRHHLTFSPHCTSVGVNLMLRWFYRCDNDKCFHALIHFSFHFSVFVCIMIIKILYFLQQSLKSFHTTQLKMCCYKQHETNHAAAMTFDGSWKPGVDYRYKIFTDYPLPIVQPLNTSRRSVNARDHVD